VIAGLVLAAGAGRRFGPDSKLLADLHGRPLLEYAIRAQCAVPELERVVVVLGAHASAVIERVDLHARSRRSVGTGRTVRRLPCAAAWLR
jgi:CTP:molybdopterin cytidylyltransferase MocA